MSMWPEGGEGLLGGWVGGGEMLCHHCPALCTETTADGGVFVCIERERGGGVVHYIVSILTVLPNWCLIHRKTKYNGRGFSSQVRSLNWLRQISYISLFVKPRLSVSVLQKLNGSKSREVFRVSLHV